MGRLPMSVLALGAVLDGKHDYIIIDGNIDRQALSTLRTLCSTNQSIDVLAVSVMPGTQMLNAIDHCKTLRQEFPTLRILWGGYFPSMHTDAVLNSEVVNYVIQGQAERSLIEFINMLRGKTSIESVHNLSYRTNSSIHHNPHYPIFDPNLRPMFPYHAVRMEDYALQTFVGKRTFCHESSVGCPHKCNFCGVVDVFNSRWKAETPDRTVEIVRHLQQRYGMDGIEFHDSDFFVTEKRVIDLSERMIDLHLGWWGEGRIDTLLAYDVRTWDIMKRSGLKMVFFGAESGLDETLQLMDKGGVTIEKTKAIAARCKEFQIQSEFSFVMGAHPTKTREDIDATIQLMYELQAINPSSQMHPFVYTPAPFGTIYDKAIEGGLKYPVNLDEWASHEWAQYTLRRNPHTPWLTKPMYNRIVNFRAVYQAYIPKMNDRQISAWKLFILKVISSWRYKLRFFGGAYEVRFFLKTLMKSASPDEGF